MKSEVKIDDEVISQVLLEFNVHRNDADFDELSAYLKLRYLHYQLSARGSHQRDVAS